jgi:hypothetical protein
MDDFQDYSSRSGINPESLQRCRHIRENPVGTLRICAGFPGGGTLLYRDRFGEILGLIHIEMCPAMLA